MNLEQPSVEIFGIIIAEPITSLTDVLISIVCVWAYYKLKNSKSQLKEIKFLKIFFVSMAFATLWGGIVGHGLQHYLGFAWKLPAWLTSMISVAFLERSAILYASRVIPKKVGVFFSYLNIAELITFIIITFTLLEFRWVEIHSAYGILIVVGGFSSFMFFKTKSKSSLYYLFGVLLCILSAFVFIQKIGINKWFNHMDISHVFMAIGAWSFANAGLKMLDQKE